MQRVMKLFVVCVTVALVSAPALARADGYVTPWIGVNTVSGSDDNRTTFGATAGYMGAGVFGFEGDLGFTPKFFGSNQITGDSRAITAMGNAIIGIPVGGAHGAGVRPFVTGGLGLLWTKWEDPTLLDVDHSNSDFAYNLGAGLMGFFGQHVGLRGEAKYFRTLEDSNLGAGVDFDPGAIHFWRLSVGLTFR